MIKHTIILHQVDQEDYWLINPIVVELPQESPFYEDALNSVKDIITSDEFVTELIKTYDIKQVAFEKLGLEYPDNDLDLQLKEINTRRGLKYIFNIVDVDAEVLFTYEHELKIAFGKMFS